MTSILFDVEQVIKHYPQQRVPANDNINLQVATQEVFGLLGENGAGKSTLVKQMVNLLKSDAGSIRFNGRDVATNPEYVAQHVGYMPQGSQALNNMTVGEALYFTAHLRGLTRYDARLERRRLLQKWGLEPLEKRNCNHLSGGQSRLVQLAVATAGRPSTIILDEPTNDLDPQKRRLVWEVIRSLNQEHGTTVIFITHDALEAEKVIERVGIMRQGRLVALGTPAALKQSISPLLRLELTFDPASPPSIPQRYERVALATGRWLIYVKQQEAGHFLNGLDFSAIEDFKLYSATLEDLYLHFVDDNDG